MKAEELKNKTVDELNKLLLDKRKAQMNMRFQQGMSFSQKRATMLKSLTKVITIN